MSATNFTPIQLYRSTTAAAVPLAANLASGELAINVTDGKLYYNDSGVVKVIAGTGGTGVVAGSNTQLQFNNSGVFGASASLTWNGTSLAVTGTVAVTGALTATLDSSFTSTGAVKIPASTTANRPAGTTGQIRYNTSLNTFEGYGAASWGAIGGGATGAGGDTVFQENQLIVTTSYTLSTGKSAMSVGPITINASVAVTVPSGYRWVVL